MNRRELQELQERQGQREWYSQRQKSAFQKKRVPWLTVSQRRAVPDDFRHYLALCFKAEALRRRGIQAEVRGRKRRWLIVIQGRNV